MLGTGTLEKYLELRWLELGLTTERAGDIEKYNDPLIVRTKFL